MRQRDGVRRRPRMVLFLVLTLVTTWVARTSAQPIGHNGMVSTSHPLASRAGLRILERGGNAVDAAIASAAVIAVVNPFMAGLGGVGGHALVYDASTGKTEALDFRGISPQAAKLEMYRGDRLWDFAKRATDGPLAPLVPGILAGWAALHERYGSLSWSELFQPAIEYAEKGFPLTPSVARSLRTGPMSKVRRYPYGLSLFTKNGRDLEAGAIWVQKDLAATLRAIAAHGADEFYKGGLAEKIARHFREIDGLITEEDLAAYEVRWSEPIATTYRGYKVLTHGPGAGGTMLLQSLNVLEGFDLETLSRNSTDYIHLVAETEKLAFQDDDRYNTAKTGAPIPGEKLISKDYATEQRGRIDKGSAQFHPQVSPPPVASASPDTHHHTVIDKDHNVVTMTQTLMYASGVAVPGTGLFFNNGMCYFSLDPNDVNRIEGRQRTRSTMCPTIVFRLDRPYVALGAAGGWTIPQTVLQTILNVIDFKLGIAEAARGPRFILRYLQNSIPYVPGTELSLDAGIPTEVRQQLEARGHRPIPGGRGRPLNVILVDPKSGALWGTGEVATW